MHTGQLIYSIKYDLGGAIDDTVHNKEKIFDVLKKCFPKITENDDDLTIFNLSYLSRSSLSYFIHEQELPSEDGAWVKKVLFDSSGVVTIWLSAPSVQASTPQKLGGKLMILHDKFIEDKNLDYLIYLNEASQLRGRLQDKEVPTSSGTINFRHVVGDIRRCLKPFLGRRHCYNFHDYRPIFIVDDTSFNNQPLRNALLNLRHLTDSSEDFNDNISTSSGTDRFIGNTWSYVCRDRAWNNELMNMFSHAHSSWFQIHGSIFEMKDIEDVMNRRLTSDMSANDEDISELVRYLELRKNVMFSEMFEALNSDFITKNSQCKADLDIFMKQFGINKQIEILKEYSERISNYLRSYNEHLLLVQSKELSRNTFVLELLFLLNTVAGIAGFVTIFFATDLNVAFVWSLPQLIAVIIVCFSLVFYSMIVLRGRFLRRRNKDTSLQDEWLDKLEIK